MRIIILAVVGCLLLLTSPACNREVEIQGSVFIVTKGAENQKLGLVIVSAVPADRMKQFVENKKSHIKSQLDRLKKADESRGADLAAAQKGYDEAKKMLDDLLAEKTAIASRQEELGSSINPYLDSPYLVDEDDSSALAAEVAKQRKVRQQLRSLAQQATKNASLADAARARLAAADKQLTDAKTQVAAERQKMLDLLNEAALFEGIPEGSAKAVTDADGKFTIKLPASGKYALAARAERRVYDKTERYYWIVWVEAGGRGSKQVMLTNQNMLGQEADDSVFDLKELLPKGTARDTASGTSL